jgi:hypothetical protein
MAGRAEEEPRGWRARGRARLRKALHWGQRHIPPGLRTAAGLVLIVAGCFGFLPVLGFWMIPLGAALVALDVPPLRRRLHDRLMDEPDQGADDGPRS